MTFVVCMVPGEQAEHRFNSVATFQTAGGAAVGIGWDFGIVLTVGGNAHNVVPVKTTQLRQMVAVEADIVGENGTDFVLTEPGTQISDGFGSGAEHRLNWCLDEQSAFIHAADLTLNGQDVIFSFD